MLETVTVEQAIKRGKRTINLPITIFYILLIPIGYYIDSNNNQPGWESVAIVIMLLLFPWLYWSFMITKWRIWAFENVKNVHELKKQAVKADLIWPDGSFFEKTEIRTAKDKQKLSLLEVKFEQQEVFFDDLK